MEDLNSYRKEIDAINSELIRLLEKRMELSEKIAEYKRANGMAVYDPVREGEILDRIVKNADSRYADELRNIFVSIMDESKKRQNKLIK